MSRFIVIDGLDGSGKGTQIKLLQKHFEHRPVAFTREPGGTPRAERIREILLDTKLGNSAGLTDILLFFAARSSHLFAVLHWLTNGWHVICDRFDSSTYAFQVCGEERPDLESKFVQLRHWVVDVFPAAYIFLDLPAEVAYARCRLAAEEKTSVFDLKPLEYHERVREGFHKFAERFGDANTKMIFIDANRPIEEVQEELLAVIEGIFEADDDNREE